MASTDPAVDAGAPNLNLTPEEKRVYGQLFRQADTESVGVVTGEIAVKFFEKTRLDSRVLGEIWQIADKENRGFLTPAGFGIVLRLIGHAQAGREPSPEIALQQGPLPRFDGFTPNPAPPAPPPAVLQALATGNAAPIRIPQLTPDKVAQYAGLFERQAPSGSNMLPGDQAKQIFEKSGLPNDVLGRIWMLADTEQRGALVQTEFVIAMHLLASMKSGALRGLPTILPAALYEAATRRGPVGGVIPRQQSPTTATPPISAVPRQLTGQGPVPQMRTGSPLGRPPVVAQTTGDWLVTPSDKARFDQLYDELDKTKKGYITGEEAVPFFSQSNLSEDALAQIWDLADINSKGTLSKDEFAVAMYLIRQQRSKRDGVTALPTTLPPSLVPPRLRAQVRPQAVASAFDPPPPRVQPPPPKPPSALDDLFGLDDPQPPAPIQVALGTGGSANDPFASSISPPAPSSPVRPTATGSTFKPFVPSSSFGRGLTTHGTGGSNNSAPGLTATSGLVKATPPPVSFEDDLLGDAEPEITKSLNNETTELANLSNQIGSLTKQVQDVQNQRSATQNELTQVSAQKKNFEQRLAQLRAVYEKEARDVRSLETQLTAARNETKKLQTEAAMIDATYQDLQNQHRQIVTALQGDQQENASLKEKIRAVNAEIAQLKPQIEKLKSEARQQKGLVAINKKQLATNEGERERLKTEVEDLTKSNEELARQVSSSSSPVLTQVASPALSTASGNNPFFRRTGSTDIAQTFSPPLRSFNDKSFDDVFGPAAASSSQAGTPPPPAALGLFKPQNTGTSTGSVGSFATPASTSPNVSRQPTVVSESQTPQDSRQLAPAFPAFGDSPDTSRQLSPPLSRASQGDASQESQSTTNEAAPTAGAGSDTKAAPAETKPSVFGAAEDANKAASKDSDPFGAVDQAKAKEDFESAFASFKNAKANTSSSNVDAAKAFSNFSTEFPPISELERDDESESESDRGGFDDDFAPASPPPKPTDKRTESRSASPTLTKSVQDISNAGPTSSAAPEPAATSEKPSSPAPTTSSVSKLSGQSVDDIFGSAHATPTAAPAPATQPAAASVSTKGAFDDLDDDFEGLEDAKEGSADDDFANISRSGLDDFNPVFDSSPPPSQSKSESAKSSGPFGIESSFDFASLSGASASGSTVAASATSAPAQAKPATTADSHDWDAIFDGFDDTPRPSSPPAGASNGTTKEPPRPAAPGRALTEEGEHDDPILKNLTSMGYSRSDALSALEKYDYNLERAANHLANQS
jgi:epidermal growth factor receptor substrate 15